MAMTSKVSKKEEKYFEAVGRRKTSIARVRLFVMQKGTEITINEKSLEKYFSTSALRKIVEEALSTVGIKFYIITAKLKGGGIHSQAEALRHGISRAILKVNPEHRKGLKVKGFLKRDPRMKERRKFGLKKARKAPKWAKR